MSDNAPYTHIFVAYASEDQKAHDTLCAHLPTKLNRNAKVLMFVLNIS